MKNVCGDCRNELTTVHNWTEIGYAFLDDVSEDETA